MDFKLLMIFNYIYFVNTPLPFEGDILHPNLQNHHPVRQQHDTHDLLVEQSLPLKVILDPLKILQIDNELLHLIAHVITLLKY